MSADTLQKRLYDRSPVWLQNVLISAYGWRRHRQRHGGDWADHVERLTESQWWDLEEFRRYQLRRLRSLVDHAMEYVPYFRETFGALGIESERLTDIRTLPILEKDTLRTRLDDCVSRRWPRSALLEYHTSGSTGTPLTYFIHPEDHRERMAMLERQRHWAGVAEGDRCATFGGALIVPRGLEDGPLWRYNHFGRQLFFSSYHLSPGHLPRYVSKLNSFRPDILEGYPSALYTVAQWLRHHDDPSTIRPKAVLTTGETLHDHQREAIADAFGSTVYNYYGSSEAAPIITQCREGSLHINPESGIFEVLDPDGHEAGPGEVGELIVTSFQTRAMPLIRYRIRDAVVLEDPGPCACGRWMPRIRSVIGRMDDMVFTPDRGWVGRLSQAVKVFPGSIREAQIVQENLHSVAVRLVVDQQRFEEDQLTPLLRDLRARLGDEIEIRIEYVDAIERGANNKFPYVVSKLSDKERETIASWKTRP